ncbi:MAG: DMT family transporter [Micrococcaceae bacterium]
MNAQAKGVTRGLLGGLLWALDTVLIGVIVKMSPLKDYAFLAPLVATFLHDTFSALWLLIYNTATKKIHTIKDVLKSKKVLWVALGGILGGPIGMTSYTLAIHYIGSSETAIISATYPAIGAVLGVIFLREKITKLGIVGLILIITATVLMTSSSSAPQDNLKLGLMFALICAFAWGAESVALSHGMEEETLPQIALQIRQILSFLIYSSLVMPFLGGYKVVGQVIGSNTIWLIVFTGFVGTAALLFYYSSVDEIGAIQSMGLNISYSAWAVFIGFFFGQAAGLREILLALVIMAGAIMTTENPRDFLSIFNFKKSATEAKVKDS